MARAITIDGKFFADGPHRFDFRGVTYGTFAPRVSDDCPYPDRDQMKRDFAAISEAGFTVVRTYTEPTTDLLELAADWNLRVLAGVFYPDWRYVIGGSRREFRRVAREARDIVRAATRRLSGDETVLALTLGNEIPADVVRWFGTAAVADALRSVIDVVRDEDDTQLVTYANYPTAEYLPLEELDFLTFNVFLENQDDLRRYVTRLHHLAGDRPLVLGEMGLDAGATRRGELHQQDVLRWQLDTALERGVAGTCIFSWTDDWCVAGVPVEGWHFGLTDRDRRERPALETAARANQRTVRDLDVAWPSISVVVCAYNAGTTLDECLEHTCALDYPDLEVLVVDDGSTDDTAAIVRRHPRATLVQIVHAGLSAARNEGLRSARGDLIAYLDADAYPTPEWPYFLALGMDRPEVGGVGGPNVGPASDGRAASVVAAAPGGPVHVLISDSVAEHVPGCNMAFRKDVLLAVGGFDPVFEAAGDDVDLCWRVIDRGWTIGFHPAALVWHHRRSGLLAYLRQQRGYGRSEALVEARHPNRFTRLGTARWKGRIYQAQTVRSSIQRVYRGPFGTAAYQSVYAAGGDALDLVHQAGVPLAMLLVVTLPLGVLERWLAAPAGVAVVALLALMVFDAGRATTRRIAGSRSLTFGLRVALHQLLQPVVRTWARNGARRAAFRGLAAAQPTPTPVAASRAGVAVFEDDRPRAEFAAALLDGLRTSGTRSFVATAWQDHDGTVLLSPLVRGELLTSSHPIGYVQVRIRAKLRWVRVLVASSVAVALLPAVPVLSAVVLGVCGVMTTLGLVRSRTTLAGLVGKPAI